jgi:glycosyltransferase involved in cell wall biosynthesis
VDNNLLRATNLIVSTRFEEKQIRKLGFDTPISLLPNGVALENLQLPTRKDAQTKLQLNGCEFVILYLGRIHPKKGIHLLLQAFEKLSQKIKSVRLLIAGSFSNRQYAKTISSSVDTLITRKQISFLGELSDQDKLFAFAAADLFVLPSYSEGFSNSVLEAMACRLPVLITHGCNFPEVATRRAGMITHPEAHAIQLALEQMIQDPDLADMGERGRAMIEERFNWRSLSGELFTTIQKQVKLFASYHNA